NGKLIMVRDKLKSFLLWNYIITFMLSNLGKVAFFSIVEYRTLNLDNGFSIISFILNILYLLASISLLTFITKKLNQIRKGTKYQNIQEKVKANDSVKALFEKVKNKYYIQEIFLTVVGVRAVLHNIIIAAIKSPTLQCSLLIIIGLLMLAYVTAFRPHI